MKKEKVKINLGCGVHLLGGFINIDNTFDLKTLKGKKGIFGQAKIDKGAKFVQADMRKLPFKDNTVDYIECLEAIEHVPFKEVELVLKEMLRVLKPGGKTVIFTTDFNDIARIWTEIIEDQPFNAERWFNMVSLIYGHQLTEGEYHRAAFTPTYFNGLMQACGFTNFKMIGYPRGCLPPKFKGAKWPKKPMGCAMILIEAIKKN